MRRRDFIAGLAGAVAVPHVARGQERKLPTIGFLGASTAFNWTGWTAAFVTRLRELGWIEGRTVAIEYRWAEGRSERFTAIANEFVRLKVDVILTVGGAASAAQQVTTTIPIVHAMATDPVGSGLAASLSRPGGNVTGLSIQSADIAGKRIEIFRELLPGLRRLAIIGNADMPPRTSTRRKPQHADLVSKSTCSKSVARKISLPRSEHSTEACRPSTYALIR